MMKKEFNEKKIHPVTTCINMFDFENKDVDLRGWFYDILNLFDECGLVPTILSGSGITTQSYITVKNGIKKFEACDFKGVDSLWICATPSSDLRNPFKWLMQLSIDLASNREVFSLDFDSELMSFNEGTMGGIFKRIGEYCGARYGFGVQRPFDVAGPEYAYGVGYNLPEFDRDPTIRAWAEKESDLIMHWSHKYRMFPREYQPGDLRQVYPYNLLCKEHLKRNVGGGQTFREWVEKDASHGQLKKLTEDRWIWSVPVESILEITKSLESSGMILCL